MKTVKSRKILFLIMAFIFSVCIGFLTMSSSRVLAQESVDESSAYFTLKGEKSTNISFANDSLTAKVKTEDTLEFVNKLIADDLTLTIKVPTNIERFSLHLTAKSYGANGNVDKQGTLVSEIDNELVVDTLNKTASFNGGNNIIYSEYSDRILVLSFKVENNFILANVNGTDILFSDEFYKVEDIDKVVVGLKFEFLAVNSSSENAEFYIVSVGQKTGDDKFTQKFIKEDGIIKSALPRVALEDSFFSQNAENNSVISGYIYKPACKGYAVLDGETNLFTLKQTENVSTNDIYINDGSIMFREEDETASTRMSFNVMKGLDVIETYEVSVVADGKDVEANVPVYKDASECEKELNAFKQKLLENTKQEYDVGDGKKEEYCIRIGSGQYLEVPSLKNLVADNATSYENLTRTIYYRTKTSSWTSASNDKIPVNTAGTYEFYVVFKDVNGNVMDRDDFIENEEDNVVTYGKYKSYIFTFTLVDDAPISVEAIMQGDGYEGVRYTATSFTIKASDYTTKYTLYYRANENSSWLEIPMLKDIEEDFDNGTFVYSDIKNIDYDGSLVFTPIVKGQYKIECSISSNSTIAKTASDSCTINVLKVPNTVVPDNHWVEDNILSIIFLSIGSVSLIGIIVLLFAKPKDNAKKSSKKTK